MDMIPNHDSSAAALPPARVQPRRARLFAVVAGLAAGLLAWGAGEWLLDFFPPALTPGDFGSELLVPSSETKAWADAKNATLAFGVLGGLLGCGLGIAGGLAARSPRRAVAAGLVGLVLAAGAAVALGASILSFCHERRLTLPQDDLTFAIPLHLALWAPPGALAGLAFGMGLGGKRRALQGFIGGLLGAALGAVAFELAGAALFPLAETVRARSLTAESRLLARVLVAGFCALGAALTVQERPTASEPAR